MLMEYTRNICVVAAIIEQEGRYLITRRRPSGILAGLWEFPSGKVEPGETNEEAIKREIRERVGVDVIVNRLRAHRTQHYVGYSVELVLYEASILPGQEPCPVRVAEFRWVPAQELERYPFPPADQATTDLLLGMRPPLPDRHYAANS
jgi:8-oxo-dGTP diphosphatase